jgi:hypothetical protein
MIFKKVPLITDPTRQIQEWQFQYLSSDTIGSYQIISNPSSVTNQPTIRHYTVRATDSVRE